MKISMLAIVLVLTGCAGTSEYGQMTSVQIKSMSSMRNPVCRQVGSYLYCNEQ